jgi:hypothetical protein
MGLVHPSPHVEIRVIPEHLGARRMPRFESLETLDVPEFGSPLRRSPRRLVELAIDRQRLGCTVADILLRQRDPHVQDTGIRKLGPLRLGGAAPEAKDRQRQAQSVALHARKLSGAWAKRSKNSQSTRGQSC